ERAVGLARGSLAAPTGHGACRVRDIGAQREPAPPARERRQVPAAAAHVDQPGSFVPSLSERREPVEQRAEQARPLGGYLLRREQPRILRLVRVLELDRGRPLHRKRAATGRAPPMTHAAIDERARTGRPAAPRTGFRADLERLRAPRGLAVAPGPGHAVQRLLELVRRALPRVVALDVLAACLPQARVARGIAFLVAEKTLEIFGHQPGGRPAED